MSSGGGVEEIESLDQLIDDNLSFFAGEIEDTWYSEGLDEGIVAILDNLEEINKNNIYTTEVTPKMIQKTTTEYSNNSTVSETLYLSVLNCFIEKKNTDLIENITNLDDIYYVLSDSKHVLDTNIKEDISIVKSREDENHDWDVLDTIDKSHKFPGDDVDFLSKECVYLQLVSLNSDVDEILLSLFD